MKRDKNSELKRLLSFTGKSKGLLSFSEVLSAVSALFILMPFICVYFAAKELVAAFCGSGVNTDALIAWGVKALVAEFIGLALYFFALLCSHVVAFRTEKNLKMAALKAMSKLPLGYFEANPSGVLRKTIDDNSFQTETFIAHQLPDLVGAYVTMIVSMILMVAFDFRIGLPLLVLYVISFFLQGALMGKESMEFMKTYQDALGTMNHEAVEYVRGISVVKVFGRTVESFTKFNKAIKDYKDNALSYTLSCRKGMVAFSSLINSSFIVLIPAGIIVAKNTDNLVDFTQKFLFYLIFTPACSVMLNKIMYMTSYKMQAEEAMRRIDTILTAKPMHFVSDNHSDIGHDIEFDNVTFAYDGAQKNAVENLSFKAEEGSLTAIVGHSGSGKTTTASLIARFYDCNQGTIRIGKKNIKEISQKELMDKVSFVFQNPKLFKESLYKNICAARPEATKEEALKAAHLAQCDDILAKFSQGIDTVVGQKGVYLSGGETQRIAIARAILKNAPVLILDEATAYADPENESKISEALKELMKNKTVIMIAHRLSTVTNADNILVMKEGRLIESGTHEELINKKGEYEMMWNNYKKAKNWHIENTENEREVQVC